MSASVCRKNSCRDQGGLRRTTREAQVDTMRELSKSLILRSPFIQYRLCRDVNSTLGIRPKNYQTPPPEHNYV